MAEEKYRRANLEASIDLRVGSATEIVEELTGPFDCVFFDADQISAPEQLQLLLPELTCDALLLADNVLSHPEETFECLTDFQILRPQWFQSGKDCTSLIVHKFPASLRLGPQSTS